MEVNIRYLTVGKWKENAYIVEYKDTSVLIDPGDSFDALDQFFDAVATKHVSILNTHGHFDHVGAVEQFKEKYNIPFYLHSKDLQLVRQANLYRKLAGDISVFKTPGIDFMLDNIGYIPLVDKKIKVHHTPGHSNGSVCFEIDNNLISGDVLFQNSLGRTDLPGGNKTLLTDSVKYIIDNFEGYKIFPGHGPSFYLNEETIENLITLLNGGLHRTN